MVALTDLDTIEEFDIWKKIIPLFKNLKDYSFGIATTNLPPFPSEF